MGNTIICTNDGRTYQKPGFAKTAAGVAAAYASAEALNYLTRPLNKFVTKNIRKAALNADTAEITNGLQEALKLSGIDKKVKIVNMNEKTVVLSPLDFLPDKLKNNKFLKSIIEQIDMSGAIKKGKNAGFSNFTNKILINTQKLGAAGFHEIGHAINFNKSPFWKTLQILRYPAMALPGWFMLIALFKRKKAEGEETKGFFDKVTTYIKNNVGKLSVAASIPVVAEELMATHRGNALAKKVLSPEIAKKVFHVNKLGAVTYISSALVTAGTAYLCGKVRDAIASPKEIVNKD